jgi:uncharacterized protein (TIGR02246 family)
MRAALALAAFLMTPGLAGAAETAPKAAPAAAASDEQAIRTLEQRWSEMINAKNLAGIVNLYAPDGMVMPAGAPLAQGPAALRQTWSSLLAAPGLKATLTPVQVDVAASGDLAVDRGTYALTTDSPKGPVTERGKYIVVWKKQGGQWKVANDMFSSDAPTP